VDFHIDLVRNDFKAGTQSAVARVYLSEDSYGLIVKDTAGQHYENNIFDALGEQAKGPAATIVDALARLFKGPYLVASDPHGDQECPFAEGPLPMEQVEVTGDFVLPAV
jgi:hypothetical protein